MDKFGAMTGILSYKQRTGIRRLPIGKIPQFCLSSHRKMYTAEEMANLLSGNILIEEKLDGSDEICQSPNGQFMIYGENLRVRHSIAYCRLPSFFIVYDVYDTANRAWLSRAEKEAYCNSNGYAISPKLYEGAGLSADDIERRFLSQPILSAFDSHSLIEGVVVKNMDKRLFGKAVRVEFLEGIDLQGDYRKQNRGEKDKHNRLGIYGQ